MSKYTKYRLYQKYETRGSQEAIPVYPNTFSIDGDGTMPLVIVEENSRDCGYTGETQPMYRWYTLPITSYYVCDACQGAQYQWVNIPIVQDWECVGTTKYYKQKKQISVDGGLTWADVTPPQYQRGAVYETSSQSCGYRTRTTTGTPYCEGYDKYVDVYTETSSDGGSSWITASTTPTMVEHNSAYCGYIEPQYRTTSGTSYCSGYAKYVPVYSQVSYDGGVTWETTATTNVLVESYSQDCGYVPPTRWVESGWTCVGYDKYVNNVEQISYDNGQTWVNTSNTSASTLIESYSTDCGVMYRWTDTNVTVCSEANKYYIAYKERSLDGGQTWTEVIPRETSLGTLVEATSMDCFKFYATYSDPKTRYKNCDGSSALTRSETLETGYVANRMTTAIIGNCVTSIGASAFTNFSSLSTVNISNNVTSIGNYAFSSCTSLQNINMPSGLTSIGNWAFGYCTSLQSITIPSGITSIGQFAFAHCGNSLYSVTCLATTPPTLGSDAFLGSYNCSIYVPCDSITAYKTAVNWSDYASSIYPIPDSCTSQYRWVADCWECQGYDKWNKSKQQVSTDGGQTWTDTGVVSATTLEEANSFTCGYGSSNPTSHYYYAEYSDGTRYAYDTDCDMILTSSEANPQCYDASRMTYAYVSGCYDSISSNCFDGHTSLSSVTLDGSGYFGWRAFADCTSLTSVTIPSAGYYIGDYAFSGCTNLSYIALKGTNPPTLGAGAFGNTNDCPIYVQANYVNTYKNASGWSTYASRIQAPPSVTLYRWVESGWTCVGFDKYTNNVQQVSYDSGFTWQNTSITSASTLIEANSTDCGYLPSNVKYNIVYQSGGNSSGACDGNSTLTSGNTKYYKQYTGMSLYIGDCVTSIASSCMESFSGLTNVYIPSTVTDVGNFAFQYCRGLISCTIGSGVTNIGYASFGQCTNLKDAVIQDGSTIIGGFYFCNSLSSATIPNSVTTIIDSAFQHCISLTSITIPSGVTSIGASAFMNCSGFTSVTVLATTPPTLGNNYVFSYTNNCPIYVPAASVSTYQSASGWSTYASRIQAIPT